MRGLFFAIFVAGTVTAAAFFPWWIVVVIGVGLFALVVAAPSADERRREEQRLADERQFAADEAFYGGVLGRHHNGRWVSVTDDDLRIWVDEHSIRRPGSRPGTGSLDSTKEELRDKLALLPPYARAVLLNQQIDEQEALDARREEVRLRYQEKTATRQADMTATEMKQAQSSIELAAQAQHLDWK